ncbi:MAG: hemolysin family protein [Propionibacteriaceae bacterium]|nr:hemolysin family protein [Propionibacteriaceae bacterium]
MTQAEWVEIAIAIACVVVAAIVTSADAAFAAMSKVRAQRLVDSGKGGAARLLEMMQNPARFINTSLFLRLLLQTAATVLAALVFFQHFAATWERIVFPLVIMLLVSYLLLGVAPRTLGRQHAEALALAMSGPLRALAVVIAPVCQFLIVIGNAITPGKGFSAGPFSSEAELRELVDVAQARDLIEATERKMIHSVFDLGDTIVKEVMVPRPDMVYIERTKTLRQGVSLALRSGFSRIPVIGADVDDVVGVLYLKDVIRRMYDNPNAQTSETVDTLMRPPTFCPDSKPVDELLREMQLTHSHVVIVIDEFGGTAGLATIEDALEEIVGEIVDEYDNEVPPVTELGPGRFRVSARLGVDELGELFGLDVDDADVETVLGLIAKTLNAVPIPGSKAVWEGIELVAERGTGRRHQIKTVLASKASVDDDEAAAVVAEKLTGMAG